ncbi:MAG: hypothetical protein OEY85_02405 [Rhodospirillales bacterium]|nr:hypothetical protein [Rhodospirillales bacterium]
MSEQARFATLASGFKYWAVGAIHGEAERLGRLHQQIAGKIGPRDSLVYLGNFLGLGPAVLQTIDELLLFRRSLIARRGAEFQDIVYLRGAQEEMWHKLLQIHFAPNPREVVEWMLKNGVESTLNAYGQSGESCQRALMGGTINISKWTAALRSRIRAYDGHDALMATLRRAAFSDDGTMLFVNAGIDVSRPLSEQTDSFWWGGQDFERIGSSYSGFRRVVRGYDHRHQGLAVHAFTATIDGGCGFGGPLIAACFDGAGELLETLEA